MKVKELIEILSELDPEAEVWKSKDPEGNGFYAVYNVSDDAYLVNGENYSTDHLYTAEDLEEDSDGDLADPVQVVLIE